MQTIIQLTDQFDISARTLRYYEEIGLLNSIRSGDYAYRMYDEDNARKIQQIVLLRKLHIPLRDIKNILEHEDSAFAVAAFQKKMIELDTEIDALSTVRAALDELLRRFENEYGISNEIKLLDDQSVHAMLESLKPLKKNLKEKTKMEELNQADRVLSRLNDVRIVYLPPFTAAAIKCFEGEQSAEHQTSVAIIKFHKDNDLLKIKPDARFFGFNHYVNGIHGYEEWVTIPDDMEVAPLRRMKKNISLEGYMQHIGWGREVLGNGSCLKNGRAIMNCTHPANTEQGALAGESLRKLFPRSMKCSDLPAGKAFLSSSICSCPSSCGRRRKSRKVSDISKTAKQYADTERV